MAEQNPLAKYQLQKAGGAGRRNTEGMFTNVNGNASRDARRMARREQRPMTFSEMQADGIARPGPGLEMFTGMDSNVFDAGMVPPVSPTMAPPMASAEEATPTAAVTPPIGAAPSGSPMYNTTRDAMLANLRAQFGAERQALEENLASRGLAASSIGAGRLGDLAGQQARAMATLEADLLAQEEARRQANNELLVRLATLFGLGS